MLALLPFISILANVLLTSLKSEGILSPTISGVISGLTALISPLLTSITSTSTPPANAMAVLAALSGTLTLLKSQSSIPAALLAQIQDLEQAVDAALSGYVLAQKGVDLSIFTALPQV